MTIEQAFKVMGLLSDAQEHITRNDKSAAIEALNNAKERLLLEIYFAEFETIDGEIKHPDGYNFEQWLKANNAFFSKPILGDVRLLLGLNIEESIAVKRALDLLIERQCLDYQQLRKKMYGDDPAPDTDDADFSDSCTLDELDDSIETAQKVLKDLTQIEESREKLRRRFGLDDTDTLP
jgi:hypothetical protein